MADAPDSVPLTKQSQLALPVAAIVVIAIGAYVVVVMIILVIRQILMQRGWCTETFSCCGKEGELQCCDCCVSLAESCNCCRNPSVSACLDSICPARRRLDCADIIMCSCCENGCCNSQEPFCDYIWVWDERKRRRRIKFIGNYKACCRTLWTWLNCHCCSEECVAGCRAKCCTETSEERVRYFKRLILSCCDCCKEGIKLDLCVECEWTQDTCTGPFCRGQDTSEECCICLNPHYVSDPSLRAEFRLVKCGKCDCTCNCQPECDNINCCCFIIGMKGHQGMQGPPQNSWHENYGYGEQGWGGHPNMGGTWGGGPAPPGTGANIPWGGGGGGPMGMSNTALSTSNLPQGNWGPGATAGPSTSPRSWGSPDYQGSLPRTPRTSEGEYPRHLPPIPPSRALSPASTSQESGRRLPPPPRAAVNT